MQRKIKMVVDVCYNGYYDRGTGNYTLVHMYIYILMYQTRKMKNVKYS